MKELFKYAVTVFFKTCLAIEIFFILLLFGHYLYIENFSQAAYNKKAFEIYLKIIAATGQTQDALPFFVKYESAENAYNDGERIVLYTGLINNAKSWDEVALVIGHEVAHGTLRHLHELYTEESGEGSVIEANADKMGAVYMMKAGFDVCTGRKIYDRWRREYGNSLNSYHPDYSYRYDELNINCD